MCNSCSDHLQPKSLCLYRSIHLLDKSSHSDSLPIDSVLFLHNLAINESNLMRFLQFKQVFFKSKYKKTLHLFLSEPSLTTFEMLN